MIQSCIGPNGVGRLVQCDQRMNVTCNASLLQENLSESISEIYWNQAKNLIFQHHNVAIRRAALIQNCFNTLENVWLFITNHLSNNARCPPINIDFFINVLMKFGLEYHKIASINLILSFQEGSRLSKE